jgi:Concanavalin A-like lectin/glucanases superfamily
MTVLGLKRQSKGLGLSPRRRRINGATSPIVVQAGLVAEWRFDDGAGQVLTDYRAGHHGQLGGTAGSDANDPAWNTGGLSFAGSHGGGANDYVITSAWTFPSPHFHVDIVGKFTGSPPPGVDFVFVAGRNTGTGSDDNTSPLTVFRDGTNAGLFFRMGNGVTNSDNVGSPGPVGICFDGGWHHIAIDYDGIDMSVYLDGAQILAKTYGLTPNSAMQPSLFGTFYDITSIPFTGILGYITVYDRVFAPAERAQQETALAAIMAARGITLP